MTTELSDTPATPVELIGETAGMIWRTLNESGPLSITKLVKSVDKPRDLVMQAVGWLAREDKIAITGEARSRTVALANLS